MQAADFVCLVFCKRCVPGHKEEGKLEADSVFLVFSIPPTPLLNTKQMPLNAHTNRRSHLLSS